MQRDYFWNLSRAILLAKESIYIHDWWLSPGKFSVGHILVLDALRFNFSCSPSWFPFLLSEIFINHMFICSIELEMRRPNKERYRLDKLLERKAKEGVKIYVII
jgi:phospholipase D1/2